MIRRPTRSTRTKTHFPHTTLFRSPARKGIISIRDMGVEGDARFVAAARVDVTERGPTTAGMKLLSVARRGGAVSPQRGERHGAMGVDQPSKRLAIGGLADMPVKTGRQ